MEWAQIEWTKKRQERLDYINNEIMKEHKFSNAIVFPSDWEVGNNHYHLSQFSLIFIYHSKITIIVNLHL